MKPSIRREAVWICACLLTIAAGCGGEIELACDEPRLYQEAVDGRRVQAPEDLDPLDPLREMPVPDAAPQAPRPPGSPCLDRPPSVLAGE